MPQLSQHACFVCRKVFKKPHWYRSHKDTTSRPVYSCPDCGKEMIYMGYKFRAPAKSETKEWKRIKQAIKDGEDWTVRTIRKEEKVEKKRLSPQMKKALGVIKTNRT